MTTRGHPIFKISKNRNTTHNKGTSNTTTPQNAKIKEPAYPCNEIWTLLRSAVLTRYRVNPADLSKAYLQVELQCHMVTRNGPISTGEIFALKSKKISKIFRFKVGKIYFEKWCARI